MSTAAFGLRPLPALSFTAAVMATTFGGCGCAQAPSSSAQQTGAAVVSDDSEHPANTAPPGTYDDAVNRLRGDDIGRFITLPSKLASTAR